MKMFSSYTGFLLVTCSYLIDCTQTLNHLLFANLVSDLRKLYSLTIECFMFYFRQCNVLLFLVFS